MTYELFRLNYASFCLKYQLDLKVVRYLYIYVIDYINIIILDDIHTAICAKCLIKNFYLSLSQ